MELQDSNQYAVKTAPFGLISANFSTGEMLMKQPKEERENARQLIIEQMAEFSKLLSMTPNDDSARMLGPTDGRELPLEDWLAAIRDSFLRLSVSVAKELNLRIQ